MNAILIIVSPIILWSLTANGNNINELCANTNGKFQILEALRLEDRILLQTQNPNDRIVYYGISGFKYSDSGFAFNSIVEVSGLPQWFKNSFLLFSLPRKSISEPHRGIAIRTQVKTREISELIATQFALTSNFEIKDAENFTLSIYKYDPNDGSDLITLFWKFPDEDVSGRIHSILSFPFSSMRPRLFVYYSEKPSKKLMARNKTIGRETDFKRHLMIEKEVNEQNGSDWTHDIENYDCVDQNVVDATFALNVITEVNSGGVTAFKFDLIEFSKQNFYIKRVDITSGDKTNHRIASQLKLLSNNTIESLFKCRPPITTTSPLTFTTTSTTVSITRPTTTTSRASTRLKTTSKGGFGGTILPMKKADNGVMICSSLPFVISFCSLFSLFI